MRGTYRGSSSRRWAGCGWILAVALLVTGTGCSGSGWQFQPEDQFGRTYYIDGAGNWGFGRFAVPHGLRGAGYQGRVTSYPWTVTFNPALDQTVGRFVAKAKGKQLAREIEHYLAGYPNNEVHIIALSAGTGVAVWACECLTPPAKVGNVVLLGSSLSSNYNMSKALARIQGSVFVYYSPNDGVLDGPVRVLGTIDGSLGTESAGLVGLRSSSSKIRNIAWNSRYEAYGWTGSHVSAVHEDFVKQVLARHVMPSRQQVAAQASDNRQTNLTVQQ